MSAHHSDAALSLQVEPNLVMSGQVRPTTKVCLPTECRLMDMVLQVQPTNDEETIADGRASSLDARMQRIAG